MVTQYTQGTVIVDVFDPKTKDLLWRGQGVAAVSDNQEQYVQSFRRLSRRFSRSSPPRLQSRAGAVTLG